MFDRCVNELVNFSKSYYFIEFTFDLSPLHAEDRAVKICILPASEFRMEPGPDFKKRADATFNVGISSGRFCDSGKNFQQRTFPGAISTDDPYHLAMFDFE